MLAPAQPRVPKLVEPILRRGFLLPLAAIVIVQILLVPPLGDFPSNDDWMYAEMVKTLSSEHRYAHHPFVQPTSVLHVVWGALFSVPFGVSHVWLRVSTLVLGLAGAWGTALCARACGFSRIGALLCSLVVITNPMYMHLSNTYMTDVPFYAYLSFSVYFYLRALRSGKAAHVFLGSLLGVAAFFVRQFGAIPAAAFAMIAALRCVKEKRRPAAAELAAYGLPWCMAAVGYAAWQQSLPGLFAWEAIPNEAPILYRAFGAFAYANVVVALLGFCLMPVAVLRAFRVYAGRDAWSRGGVVAAGVLAAVLALVFLLHIGRPMPLPGNTLHYLGVGPRSLKGLSEISDASRSMVKALWIAVTVACMGSAAILLGEATAQVRGIQKVKRKKRWPASVYTLHRAQALFLVLTASLFFVSSYTPYTAWIFDRYALPLFLPVLLLAAPPMRRRRDQVYGGACVAVCGVAFVYSIAGLQDYMSWNRARWAGINYLVNELQAPTEQIEGGYEYNGLYTSRRWLEENPVSEFSHSLKDGWWVVDGTYKVAFSTIEGYRTIKEIPYFSWLGMTTRHMHVLVREPAPG